jgi:hypothetical protein
VKVAESVTWTGCLYPLSPMSTPPPSSPSSTQHCLHRAGVEVSLDFVFRFLKLIAGERV